MDGWTHSRLDRVEPQRADERWIAGLWGHPEARVLYVDDQGNVPSANDGTSISLVPAAGPYDPQAHLLIGLVDSEPLFAQSVTQVPGAESLRAVSAALDETLRDVATTAVALHNWHASAPHCGACGGLGEVRTGGHSRVCLTCGRVRFPRTDPAIIVAVTDPDDRILLARPPSWATTRMSLVAGFVEAGECLEQAVEREVAEEVGLRVRNETYLASQPWPFPRSLMVGFHAVCDDTNFTVDGDEVEQAGWFSRSRLDEAVRSGEVSLPGQSSIASRIITAWRSGPLGSGSL